MVRRIGLRVALLCGAAFATLPALAEWDTCNYYEDPQRAIAACTRMIQAGSFQPMSHVWGARGVAYRWSGQYHAAIADFDECIRLDARDSICFGQRGIAFKLIGNRAQALADLQTAVVLDPSNQTAAIELDKLRSGR